MYYVTMHLRGKEQFTVQADDEEEAIKKATEKLCAANNLDPDTFDDDVILLNIGIRLDAIFYGEKDYGTTLIKETTRNG